MGLNLFGAGAQQLALGGVAGAAGRKVFVVSVRGTRRVIGEAFTKGDGTIELYLTEIPSDGKLVLAREGE